MLNTIILAIIAMCIAYKTFHKKHAFDIDETCWLKVRDKILKEDYAGVMYSMLTSNSPVVIRHRNPLSLDKRHAVQKLFPPQIRLEFQQVEYNGEINRLYGRGDFFLPGLYNSLMVLLKREIEEAAFSEYEKNEKGDWVRK